MSQYRIYLSVRRADTGKQVADITIVPFPVDALIAENIVEQFSSGRRALTIDAYKTGLKEFWSTDSMLFVVMKELVSEPGTWLADVTPGTMATLMQVNVARSLEKACRAVDKDIEERGAVQAETVDLVRSALFLIDK